MTAKGGKAGLRLWIVLLAILAFPLPKSYAQNLSGIINSLDGFFRSVGITDLYKYAKNRDSTFYVSPPGDFDIRLSMNLAGSIMHTKGSESGTNNKFRSHISSESVVSSSVTVGYKGVALGYTFNPFSDSKSKDDRRFNVTLYGNLLGLDFSYYNIKSFSGYSRLGDEKYTIPFGEPNMKLFLLNGFVIFNHKRYSFPAGVGQSNIQKRSSGSLIGGISYSRNKTNVASVGFGEPSIKIDSKVLSIGAGYGYNYVPRENALISFMFLPKFVVYDSSFVDVDHYDIKQTFKRPELTYSANFAAVRWFGPIYVAFTALADAYSSHHTSSGFHLLQIQWQLHAHLGVNF